MPIKRQSQLQQTINFATSSPIFKKIRYDTVKTLYNVTRYNRIFNIQHKIAGNGSVSI